MKRKSFVVLVLLLVGGLLPVLAQSMPYDSAKVREVMQTNLAQLRALGPALQADNFQAAGAAFLQLAQDSQSLMAMSPPKGDKAEWERINGALVRAALEGAMACLDENKEAANAAMNDIVAQRNAGHATFR